MSDTDPTPPTPPEGEPPPQDPNTITVPVTPPEQPAGNLRQPRAGEPPQVFTDADVERIRQEERARYAAEQQRADQLQNELAAFRKAEEDRQAAEAKATKDAEKVAKKKAEEEMELRDLIAKKEEEWQSQLEQERQERERAFAMLEQERRHASLQTYMAQRMAAEAEDIAPELRDLVSGNSEQEIDASITLLKQKSEAILGNYQQYLQRQNAGRPTVGVTAPPVGPMETSQTSRTYTADELKALSAEEYAAERENLLRAASASRRQ